MALDTFAPAHEPLTKKTTPTAEILGAGLVLLACLLAMFHQTVFSAFDLTEGGGDSVLVNLLLEHQWRWISGDAAHRDLWSPPFFFPQPHTAAYTDLFVGAFPAYAVWRLLGADPQTAFQLWMMAMSALNYLAVYLVLRGLLRTSAAASSLSAAFFAMGSPRVAQIGHPQLLPGFFVVAAFAGVYILISAPPSLLTHRRLIAGLALLAGGVTAQIYTEVYNAWYLAFSGAVALACSMGVPAFRKRLWAWLRAHWHAAALSVLVAALLAVPAAWLYLGVLRQFGGRQYAEVAHFLPSAKAWLAQGPSHWIYGPLNRGVGIGPNFGGQEMFNGIGLITTALVLMGFIRFRNRPAVAIWGGVAALSMLVSLSWPGGFSLWRFAYAYFPAASAIRAVSRFGVFLLLPASIGVALSLDWLSERLSPAVAAFCMLAVFAEQAGSSGMVPVYSRATVQAPAEAIVHRLRPKCKAFLASFTGDAAGAPWMHIFAMWAGIQAGVPTLNGYSGEFPPGWPLADVAMASPADHERISTAIHDWMRRHPREIGNVCWITSDAPGPMLIENTETGGGAN